MSLPYNLAARLREEGAQTNGRNSAPHTFVTYKHCRDCATLASVERRKRDPAAREAQQATNRRYYKATAHKQRERKRRYYKATAHKQRESSRLRLAAKGGYAPPLPTDKVPGKACPVCSAPFNAKNPPCLDHDHQTGFVRGFICGSCNVGIGRLGDDVARIYAAANYLQLSNSEQLDLLTESMGIPPFPRLD